MPRGVRRLRVGTGVAGYHQANGWYSYQPLKDVCAETSSVNGSFFGKLSPVHVFAGGLQTGNTCRSASNS